ncbi:hypothetical protein EVAR_22113_1 [Eumeta japonica]|uniref:Uncharacterized protein n=1 Tax=Eumeta variegata TaxID=151549 RepID=A0A4C1W153_EUMVA|nr:hypothetical protein EVAR_22113_1 [Eumeta japonica]
MPETYRYEIRVYILNVQKTENIVSCLFNYHVTFARQNCEPRLYAGNYLQIASATSATADGLAPEGASQTKRFCLQVIKKRPRKKFCLQVIKKRPRKPDVADVQEWCSAATRPAKRGCVGCFNAPCTLVDVTVGNFLRMCLVGMKLISGGARRRRRRRPPTASRLKAPRKQKSFAYKLLKRGLAKSFAYKLLKRGLANLMSPTSKSGVAPPLSKLIEVGFLCPRRGGLRAGRETFRCFSLSGRNEKYFSLCDIRRVAVAVPFPDNKPAYVVFMSKVCV